MQELLSTVFATTAASTFETFIPRLLELRGPPQEGRSFPSFPAIPIRKHQTIQASPALRFFLYTIPSTGAPSVRLSKGVPNPYQAIPPGPCRRTIHPSIPSEHSRFQTDRAYNLPSAPPIQVRPTTLTSYCCQCSRRHELVFHHPRKHMPLSLRDISHVVS